MDTTLHRRLVIRGLGAALAAGLMLLAVAGIAWARPITHTETMKTVDGPYSDESTLCQTEIYTTTFVGHTVVHYTYFPETGALSYHIVAYAKVLSVPLDGTGPTYTGNTRLVERDNIRNVKRGELVEIGTRLDRFVARGSDGSRVFGQTHLHFTINANGVKTVDFDKPKLVCA